MTNLWGLQLLTFCFICCIGIVPLRVPEAKHFAIIREEREKVELMDLEIGGKPSIVVAKVDQDHLEDCVSQSSSSSYDSYKSSSEDEE